MKQKIEGVRGTWEKYKYVILVALVGMGLLLWPEEKQQITEVPAGETVSAVQIQREMEQLLSNIAGVGDVRVMLTLDTDGERILAQDTHLTYSGDAMNPEKYDRASEIILKDGAAGDEPVIVRQTYPAYRGALVVCQGGGRPEVRLAVTEAVAALTGLPSDRISVAEFQ